jgi:hypothetical protein
LTILVACGHKDKGPEEPGGSSVLGMESSGDSTDRSGNMIPPEKMDEVNRDLNRKGTIISHCLATAMENKEVSKGAHGKIILEIVIDPSGHASSVKVNRSDIEAQSVQDCVIKHVQEIVFPQLPKQYETSHTYSMEAN